MRIQTWLGMGILGCLSAGCNFFSPVDHPSGDAQLLSAARACLDQGDVRCAADYYAAMSPDSSDTVYSDRAFGALDEAGADFHAFLKALGSENSNSPGEIITSLAESLSLRTPGQSARLAVFSAYLLVKQIRQPELRGLVRFVTSAALIAEILAEDVSTPGHLPASDLALQPGGCQQTISTACFSSVSCSGPTGTKLVSGPQINDLDTATASQMRGLPTFHMINAALSKLSLAVTEGHLSDSLDSSATSLVGNLMIGDIQSNLPVDNSSQIDSPCFRWGLLTNGIGRSP